MAERLRWDLAAAVTTEPGEASLARRWIEGGLVAVGLVGLAVNLIYGSTALAIVIVCCAVLGLGLRFARIGEDAAMVRSHVRTYLTGMLVFILGAALASAFGPTAFVISLPGLYLMLRAQTRRRPIHGGAPQT